MLWLGIVNFFATILKKKLIFYCDGDWKKERINDGD